MGPLGPGLHQPERCPRGRVEGGDQEDHRERGRVPDQTGHPPQGRCLGLGVLESVAHIGPGLVSNGGRPGRGVKFPPGNTTMNNIREQPESNTLAHVDTVTWSSLSNLEKPKT